MIATPPGRALVPGYERTTLAARGGTAAVYRAVRTEDSSTVALKVFDIGTDEAYRRQLLAVRRLHGVHDIHGVLPILDATTLEDGRRCIVMPYAEGGSLQDHVDRVGPLPAAQVVSFGAQLAHAVACAHHLGVIHCDITPSNLLVTDPDTAVLAGFGSASFVDAPGSSGLALGRNPFAGSATQGLRPLVDSICTRGVPRSAFDGLPAGLATALRHAVARRPDQRFEMAADLAGQLDALATDPDVEPHGAARRRNGKRAWLRLARP